jgi:hypothetical protein
MTIVAITVQGWIVCDELALIVVFHEPDASSARNDAQLVEPTVVLLPRYGPDPTIRNRPEQSHTPQLGHIALAGAAQGP